MIDVSRLIYIHGLESSSLSGKARLFAHKFPGMLTPDFAGSFDGRMAQLDRILGTVQNWTIIGSSFGGLMGAVFALDHADQLRKLVLLAPALNLPPFASRAGGAPIGTSTVVIHGTQDTVVPLEEIRPIAEKAFANLKFQVVDDDHRLHNAFGQLDWGLILD